MLEIIHVSDTHFGPDRSLTIRAANACQRAEALVAGIRALPFVPDFIVHTGDVVNDPDPAAYALAAEVLADLPAPVYYAAGNHDEVPMMRDALAFGPLEPLVAESEDRLCYRIAGATGEKVEFFVMDGRVPPVEGPHGHLSDSQIAARNRSRFSFTIPSPRSGRSGSTSISSSRMVPNSRRPSPPRRAVNCAGSFPGISTGLSPSSATGF